MSDLYNKVKKLDPARGRPEPAEERRLRLIKQDKMTDKELSEHMFGKDNV